MKNRIVARCSAAWLLCLAFPAFADDKPISGQVVDKDGKPVPGVEVAVGWNCTGKENRLEPQQKIKTDRTGRFNGSVPCDDASVPVMALDKDRNLGALRVIEPKSLSKPIKLELAPMGAVSGELALGEFEKAPRKFKVEVFVQPESISLLAFDLGSPKLALRLPVGKYELSINCEGGQPFSEMLEIEPDNLKLELGTLAIEPTKGAAKSGSSAPTWNVTEARGVSKDVKLADYKGKWVLVEFWGFW